MMTQTEPKTTRQEVQIMGEHLLTTVKRLVHEGNVRRIIIKQDEQTIVEFPLTVGVVSVMLAPTLAAVGAISALLNNCTIEVERIESSVDVSA
jgi:urease accessory protein UreF